MSFTKPRKDTGGDRNGTNGEEGSANGSRNGLTERTGLMAGGTATRERSNGKVDKKKLKRGAAEVPISVVGWLDERAGLSPTLRAMLYRKVPKGTNWFYTLGSATMFAFVSQAITGVFLAMYYDPSPIRAYDSVAYLTNQAFAGELVRGMHRWGSTVMVLLIFMHMGRTFFFGAYKYPRELNWVIGVVLLVLTLAMSFTGYLLPFDQRSYWATVVGVNINASGPVVGPFLADFLRAGPDFTATTLTRFYSLHMLLIPGLIGGLIAAHLYLVVRQGTTAPPWIHAKTKRELSEEKI